MVIHPVAFTAITSTIFEQPQKIPTANEGCLAKYVDTAKAALALGLGVNAGHDLNQDNLPQFAHGVPGLLEVSIGHALIADALEVGRTTCSVGSSFDGRND